METLSAWPVRRTGGALPLLTGLALVLAACGPTNHGRDSSMLASTGDCSSQLGSEFDRPVDAARPDQRLAGEALRHAVNRERCRRDLPPLGVSPYATRAAEGHARAMAQHGFVGHRSPVAGRETFARRLNAASARFRIAGENVARTSLYALGTEPYQVVDSSRCMFRYAGGGAPIPQQSYRMLADRVVHLWMRSADHRENMLKSRYRSLGASIAVRADRGRCGEVSAAAVFLG